MSRTYLLPTMNVEVTRDHIIYTVGFAGSEFMGKMIDELMETLMKW